MNFDNKRFYRNAFAVFASLFRFPLLETDSFSMHVYGCKVKQVQLIAAQHRSHGGHSGTLPHQFPLNFLVLRKSCFKHMGKTRKSYPLKMHFLTNLKTWQRSCHLPGRSHRDCNSQCASKELDCSLFFLLGITLAFLAGNVTFIFYSAQNDIPNQVWWRLYIYSETITCVS